MALLRLIRDCPSIPLKGAGGPDLAVRGRLYFVTYDVFSEEEVLTLLCPTLENRLYLIPPGRYRLTVTYSPKFQRDLPLVNGVPKEIKQQLCKSATHELATEPDKDTASAMMSASHVDVKEYRSGIRFHPGTKPEHSKGCILISRHDEEQLKTLIQAEKVVLLEVK